LFLAVAKTYRFKRDQSGARTAFNPRPQEKQRFKLPNRIFEE
jgi:hypothetical protein